jgi:RHS repeat-associated protein
MFPIILLIPGPRPGFPNAGNIHDTFGEPYGQTGTPQTVFGFTGEETDGTGLVNLRARYYNPALGVFPSLDPLEGGMDMPMSLNRYTYVQGDVVNMVDPSGMIGQKDLDILGQWNSCPDLEGRNRLAQSGLDTDELYFTLPCFGIAVGSATGIGNLLGYWVYLIQPRVVQGNAGACLPNRPCSLIGIAQGDLSDPVLGWQVRSFTYAGRVRINSLACNFPPQLIIGRLRFVPGLPPTVDPG